MKPFLLASLIVVSLPAVVSAQSLMEASIAARKAKAESTLVWIEPRTTEATVVVPVTPPVTPSATIGEASPVPADTLAKARAAGVALLGARLVAVRQLLTTRDRTAAQYRDACAGKQTSAGWLLRGEEVTTPNAETPVCRSTLSELESQTATYTAERAAITETARVNGILPGVLRDLLTSNNLPD